MAPKLEIVPTPTATGELVNVRIDGTTRWTCAPESLAEYDEARLEELGRDYRQRNEALQWDCDRAVGEARQGVTALEQDVRGLRASCDDLLDRNRALQDTITQLEEAPAADPKLAWTLEAIHKLVELTLEEP